MKSVVCAAALLALAGCATAPAPELPAHFAARTSDEGVQHVDVVAGSYWFRPSHIVVRANVPVELTVHKRAGVVPHSFVLQAPQAGIAAHVPLSTQLHTVRFTPIRAGSYPFYCDKSGVFGNHRLKGMHGVLEVVN